MPSTEFGLIGEDEEIFTIDADKSDGEDLNISTMIVEEEPGDVIRPLSEFDNRIGRNFGLAEDIYEYGSDEDKNGDFLGWEEAYEQEV